MWKDYFLLWGLWNVFGIQPGSAKPVLSLALQIHRRSSAVFLEQIWEGLMFHSRFRGRLSQEACGGRCEGFGRIDFCFIEWLKCDFWKYTSSVVAHSWARCWRLSWYAKRTLMHDSQQRYGRHCMYLVIWHRMVSLVHLCGILIVRLIAYFVRVYQMFFGLLKEFQTELLLQGHESSTSVYIKRLKRDVITLRSSDSGVAK